MTAAYPGMGNVYLISHESTNNLVIGYSRNPADFPLAKYIQIVPVTKVTGAYLRITAEEAARVLSSDAKELRWGDGAEAPMHDEGLEKHEWDVYRTVRYATGFNLGDLTIEQASWDILSVHAHIHAQKMMTTRSVLVNSVIETSGNWDADHVFTATTAGGGKWDVSTVDDKFILKGFNYAVQKVLKATLGQLRHKDLVMTFNPECARQMAESDEIHQYIKESPFAMAQLRGDVPNQNGQFGLPTSLYNLPIVIEDAVKITSPKEASSVTRSYVRTDTVAALLARVGGITQHYGGPSFSTVTLFMKEEMTVETKRDDDNRRTKGRVVENYVAEMTAPVAGALITACID